MLSFVNTEILEVKNVKVGVYYYKGNIEKARKLIINLAEGEQVFKNIQGRQHCEVSVMKDGVKINLIAIPMNESSRGNKFNYSFIDLAGVQDPYFTDFYHTRIRLSTVNYNVKSEYSSCYEHRMMLY